MRSSFIIIIFFRSLPRNALTSQQIQAGYLSQAAAAANYTAAANAAARAYGAAAAAQPSTMAAYAAVPAKWVIPLKKLCAIRLTYSATFIFSYGADPYLGHSIGPVPTYGISNSAELQSVNKLVRIEKSFSTFKNWRWYFWFVCPRRLPCTEVVTTDSHPIERISRKWTMSVKKRNEKQVGKKRREITKWVKTRPAAVFFFFFFNCWVFWCVCGQ